MLAIHKTIFKSYIDVSESNFHHYMFILYCLITVGLIFSISSVIYSINYLALIVFINNKFKS